MHIGVGRTDEPLQQGTDSYSNYEQKAWNILMGIEEVPPSKQIGIPYNVNGEALLLGKYSKRRSYPYQCS